MKTRVGLIGMSALAFMWSDVAIAQAPPADPAAATEQAEAPAPAEGEIIVTATAILGVPVLLLVALAARVKTQPA